jgi:hypothetical protein
MLGDYNDNVGVEHENYLKKEERTVTVEESE